MQRVPRFPPSLQDLRHMVLRDRRRPAHCSEESIMATQQWYASDAQLGYAMSTVLANRIANPLADGTPESEIRDFARKTAAYMMWSILKPAIATADEAAHHPETYTASAYPTLETMCALLSAAVMRNMRAKRPEEVLDYQSHPTIVWCKEVRDRLVEIS